MKYLITALCAALLISLGFNYYQYRHTEIRNIAGKIQYLPSPPAPPGTAVVVTQPNGSQAATVDNHPYYRDKVEKAKVLEEKISNGLPVAPEDKNKVTVVTEVNAKLESQLFAANMTINDKEKQIKEWKDKYNSVLVNNATNETKVVSEISPKIVSKEKRDRAFSPKNTYTTITSDNPSVKFYGMDSYTFKDPVHKGFAELIWDSSLQKAFDKNNWSVNSQLQMQFNPNGKLRPYIFLGGETNNPQWKIVPYYGGGFQLLIFGL